MASGFAGSIQHVTERPGLGLKVVEQPVSRPNDNLPLETLFDDKNSVDEGPSGTGPSGTGIGKLIFNKPEHIQTSKPQANVI